MSNVLIGIIGVILFIGLALAGALILGDDFKSSNNESKVAATAAQLQQLTAAINMYNIKTGTQLTPNQYRVGAGSVLIPKYLKNSPVNALGGRSIYLLDNNGGSSSETSNNPAYIAVAQLPRSRESEEICKTVSRQFGTEPHNHYTSMPNSNFGCGYSSNDPLYWILYNKI